MSSEASSLAPGATHLGFPPGFRWGSATASFQVEGATSADGRSPSIWDTFCSVPGNIRDGSNGDRACDHYRLYRSDIALMKELNLGSYRFSVAWPRVVPAADGRINQKGLDFYDRLVDELLNAGIAPFPTMYHWDLPQYLQDDGGWINRDTAFAFADYTQAVVSRLADRVVDLTTLNEPFVVANHGYVTGEHAPGIRSMAAGFAASHHLLLAHGLAAERIRAAAPASRVAIVLNFTPAEPATDSDADARATRLAHELENTWYADPISGLGYPAETAEFYKWDRNEVHEGDMETIAAPVDLLGINFYSRQFISADDSFTLPDEAPQNTMGWEIHPPSLGTLLRWLHDRYTFPSYMVTENGCPMPDDQRDGSQIADRDRIDYISSHVTRVHAAIQEGMPIEGYLVWSFMDNFEWAWGYGPTFGIVEVNFETMERVPKASALWFSRLAASNQLERDQPEPNWRN